MQILLKQYMMCFCQEVNPGILIFHRATLTGAARLLHLHTDRTRIKEWLSISSVSFYLTSGCKVCFQAEQELTAGTTAIVASSSAINSAVPSRNSRFQQPNTVEVPTQRDEGLNWEQLHKTKLILMKSVTDTVSSAWQKGNS